jgi:enoyl-CoA hydratase/carnithine racemase
MEAALAEAVAAGARLADAKPAVPSGPFAKFAAFFERTRVDDILAGRADAQRDADLDRAVKSVQKRAPLALRLAERLIEEGMKVSLAEGLRMELSHLEEVFRSQDARAGLASVVGGPQPVWAGK